MVKYVFIAISLLLVITPTAYSKVVSAQRIVALAPHVVENLFAIGAGERIVGTVEHADFPSAALTIPRVGGYNGIAVEKIMALKPDLIIAWQSGNKQADLEKLEKLGFKVIYSNPQNIAHLANELILYGQLTGQEARAQQVAKAFIARFENLTNQYKHKRPLNVFYQLWPEPMMTINQHTWIQNLLNVCQVTNVFANNRTQYPQISLENVVKKRPQVIVTADEKTDLNTSVAKWQNWPEIPAVKHQQFINVNADLLHRYSVRMLDGVEAMCQKLDKARAHYTTKSGVNS